MTVGHRMPDGWERDQQATGVVGADSAASREREREREKGEGREREREREWACAVPVADAVLLYTPSLAVRDNTGHRALAQGSHQIEISTLR